MKDNYKKYFLALIQLELISGSKCVNMTHVKALECSLEVQLLDELLLWTLDVLPTSCQHSQIFLTAGVWTPTPCYLVRIWQAMACKQPVHQIASWQHIQMYPTIFTHTLTKKCLKYKQETCVSPPCCRLVCSVHSPSIHHLHHLFFEGQGVRGWIQVTIVPQGQTTIHTLVLTFG